MKNYSFSDVVREYENGYTGDFKRVVDGCVVRFGDTMSYRADNIKGEFVKVDKEVDFTTAIKELSRKKEIYCMLDGCKTVYKYDIFCSAILDHNGVAVGMEEILEGKWFIANSNK